MTTTALRDGGGYVINGTKHFISHADVADFVILFAATGVEETSRGPKKLITALLVDKDTPGMAGPRDGDRMGGAPPPVRPADRPVPGRRVPARRYCYRAGGGGVANPARRGAA